MEYYIHTNKNGSLKGSITEFSQILYHYSTAKTVNFERLGRLHLNIEVHIVFFLLKFCVILFCI